MNTELYIIVPVHNRIEKVKNFIANLTKQKFQNFKIILVDDGSTDGVAAYVTSVYPASIVFRGSGNLWWAGSLQRGINWLKKNACKDNFVLLINDDTEFDANYLSAAIDFLKLQKEEVILFSKCYGLLNRKLIDAGVVCTWDTYFGARQAKNDSEINCCSTRGLFLQVSTLFKIGDFHPFLLPHYLSDYEYTIRAVRKGIKIKTNSDVIVWTDETPTGIREPTYTPFSKFVGTYFSPKNYSQPFYCLTFNLMTCPRRSLFAVTKNIANDFLFNLRKALRHYAVFVFIYRSYKQTKELLMKSKKIFFFS